MYESLKSVIKNKLRKQAGLARHLAMPLTYGIGTSLAYTPSGSGLSYYGTDALRGAAEGTLYFHPKIPDPLKTVAAFTNPTASVPFLNRKDPFADKPYVTPSHEITGVSENDISGFQ